MEDIQALEAAQVKALENEIPEDNSKQLDQEETMLSPDATEFGPADETVVIVVGKDDVWKATHFIGPYTVMQRQFVNGLAYWVEENGKRRRPTADRKLRKYIPPPEPAKQMWLDRDAMCLVCAAVASLAEAGNGRAEEGWNIAEVIFPDDYEGDAVHVKLSTLENGEHVRYIVQIPREFEVVGSRLP